MDKPSDWSIMLIIDAYVDARSKLKDILPGSGQSEKLENLYSTAMRILFKKDAGDVFVVDDFIEYVNDGILTNYDGVGYFATIDGDEKKSIQCNARWLQANKHDYPFIIWYSK